MGYDKSKNHIPSRFGAFFQFIRYQYPVYYSMKKESEDIIVFQRTAANKVLHLFLNLVIGVDLSLCYWYFAIEGLFFFYPIAIAIPIFFIWRIISVFTFKMTLYKDKKALKIHGRKAKRYPLNSSVFHVTRAYYNFYIGCYDKTVLFSLKKGSPACEELLGYLDSIGAEVNRYGEY